MYDWLLRNNIELYEYQPAVLHAKVAVCDSQWFTIGSYNINNISAYASIELNLNVHHAAVAGQMESTLQHILEKECQSLPRKNTCTQKIFSNNLPDGALMNLSGWPFS